MFHGSYACPRCQGETFTLQGNSDQPAAFLQCEECHLEVWLNAEPGDVELWVNPRSLP